MSLYSLGLSSSFFLSFFSIGVSLVSLVSLGSSSSGRKQQQRTIDNHLESKIYSILFIIREDFFVVVGDDRLEKRVVRNITLRN